MIGHETKASGEVASTTYSGTSLNYNTTYQWYVVVTDTGGCFDSTRYPTSGYYSFTTDNAYVTLTKEWQVLSNSTIQAFINMTNNGEADLTGINVTDTVHTNITVVGSNISATHGDNIWIVDYLNQTDSWYLEVFFNLSSQVPNGTSITNTVTAVNSSFGLSESASPSALTMCCYAIKEANLTVLEWNTTHVRYNITVTNCGDFPLHNVTIYDFFDANMSFYASNYGVLNPFDIGTVNANGGKGYLRIWCNTSYGLDPNANFTNGTRHYNNYTFVSNECANQSGSSYLFVGAITESIRVVYDAYLTNVQDIGNSVLNVLGILLIISALFVVILMFRKAGFLGGA